MNGREAINLLQKTKDDALYDRFGFKYEETDESLERAIEALEYREQKKPKEDDMHRYCCPTCKNIIGIFDREYCLDEYVSFCEFCGQAIDWRDVLRERGIRFE